MPKYLELIQANQLIFQDGGFGTMLQKHNLTSKDFQGHDGAFEYLNISRPDVVQEIHKQYLLAGAMVMDSNSFGGSRIKLKEYKLENKVYDINFAATQNAKKAIHNLKLKNCFVMGSMGPTGFLPSSTDPTLGAISFDELSSVFEEQAEALIAGGADLLLLETQHDILEVKAGIVGAKKAIANSKKDIALQVQVTVDKYSNMLFGTNILTALTIVKDMGVDVFGINCSTGPKEMENTIKLLNDYSPLPISIIPNAGMPENIDGVAHYKMTPDLFSDIIVGYLKKYKISVVGGCCGTTPEHIKALRTKIQNSKIQNLATNVQALKPLPNFCGSINTFAESPPPLIIGERINSQGSRKAKDLMLQDNYDELINLAKLQEEQSASLIDCCFAMTERNDEDRQMSFFAKKVAYAVSVPLCFDSTEATVLELAVKSYAGKPLINSINLESDKIHQILPIVAKFGLSTIALCIDESGMAKTTTKKIAIAKNIYNIAIKDYKLKPEQLVFDTLTFTLATGEEEWRNSAIETFEAIKALKKELPGVKTVLGVSNVSFGLSPDARKILNLVYLHTAVEYGLDMAIFNVAHFEQLSSLNKQEVSLAKNLILNKKTTALMDFIEYFQNQKQTISIPKPNKKEKTSLPTDMQIQQKIINRDKEGILDLLENLRKTTKPEDIINSVLLPAMKIVGDKMEKGEIILPFVLESAEIMKKSINHLEQYLDKNSNLSKGTIILATVYGDVHDIGKNLVKTITENNGYKVIDLGKQVPADIIIETAIKEKADAITLSALLVTTSKQMQIIVEKLHKLNQSIPVIIGGAAINENFAKTISIINNEVYKGGVFYSKDAFSGLKILEDVKKKRDMMNEYKKDN